MSVAGGIHRAFERLSEVGGEALQIFVRSQRQWSAKPLTEEALNCFRSARCAAPDLPIAVHGSYLVNLASSRGEVVTKSIQALDSELKRMELLGLELLVIHPGSHLGAGEEAGMEKIGEGIRKVLSGNPGKSVVLFENTAGMGSSIGWSFEQLARLLEVTGLPDRTGICLDTAHAFAAGYDR